MLLSDSTLKSLSCLESLKDCLLSDNSEADVPEEAPDESCVKIESCNFIDNSVGKAQGAGIRSIDRCVIVKNATFVGNQAKDGGAIFSKESTIIILSSNFTDNTATNQGGAIFVADDGKLFVDDSYFWKNSALSGGGIKGQKKMTMTITSTTFYNNSASDTGGALVGVDVELTITSTVFRESSAETRGGAIEVTKETKLSVEECAFDQNEGNVGGAIYMYGSEATVTNSIFTRNNGVQDGGAFFAQAESRLNISDSIIDNNSASFKGGAIRTVTFTELIIFNSTLSNNTAKLGGGSGGCICASQTPIVIKDSLVTKNRAKVRGGGVDVRDLSTVQVERSCFTENTARYGGAVYDMSSNVTVVDSRFDLHTVKENGGVFFLSDKANLKIEHSNFTENEARFFGGVIFSRRKSTSAIKASNFEKNSGKTSGGAVILQDSEFVAVDSKFQDNEAKLYGGVIHSYQNSKISIQNSIIARNKANQGGALSCQPAVANITSSNVTANSADDGGVLFATKKSTLNMRLSIFDGNVGRSDGGVFKMESDSFLLAVDCVFNSNKAEQTGGVVWVDVSSVILEKSTVTNNTAVAGGVIQAAAKSSVSLEGSKFVDNRVDANGGVVSLLESRVRVDKSSFDSNSAGREGGAIYAGYQSTTNIEHSSFILNNCTENGGVLAADTSSLTVDTSVFALSRAAHSGGAIALSSMLHVNIGASNFTKNVAEDGGAIYAKESSLVVDESVFDMNAVTNVGGALFLKQSVAKTAGSEIDITLSEMFKVNIGTSNFMKNTAEDGGAIYAEESNLIINGSLFDMNTVANTGGAFCLQQSIAKTINTEVKGSVATSGGAVFFNGSKLEVTTSAFINNTSLLKGGAILTTEMICKLRITNSTVSENTAGQAGGAVHLTPATQFDAFGTTFSKNEVKKISQHDDGRVQPNKETDALLGPERATNPLKTVRKRTLLSSTVQDVPNQEGSPRMWNWGQMFSRLRFALGLLGGARSEDLNSDAESGSDHVEECVVSGGGAIAALCPKKLVIDTCRFDSNIADQGGALAVNVERESESLVIKSTKFKGNKATDGGAVYVEHGVSSLTVRGISQFSENEAQRGGAVCLVDSAKVSIPSEETENRVVFVRNKASNGGGVFCEKCNAQFGAAVEFTENVAFEYGGGVFLQEADLETAIAEATFDSNVASFGGGLAFKDCPRVKLGEKSNVTKIFHNTALVGGGIYFELQSVVQADYQIRNTKIIDNEAIELEKMQSKNGTYALETWKSPPSKTAQEEEPGWSKCGFCKNGSGGGFYIKIHSFSESGRVCVVLQDFTATHNEAVLGDDGLIDNRQKNTTFDNLVVQTANFCIE